MQELDDQNIQDHKAYDEDIPSAPPFVGPVEEIKQEEFPHSKTNHMPLRDEISKQSNRFVYTLYTSVIFPHKNKKKIGNY